MEENKTAAVVYENHAQDSRIKEVDTAPQLNAKAGTGGGNLPLVQMRGLDTYNMVDTGDLSKTLNSAATDVDHTGAVYSPRQVRRLTPTECERLQGFPDGYTAIPYKGKPSDKCPDGPRYKALGNSWAVPCARWIGERIAAVDKKYGTAPILKEKK